MSTKLDLIKNISKNLEYLSFDDINTSLDCVLDYIKDELIKQNRIEIRGFGTISIRKRKYPNKKKYYNTVYYRMSKNVQKMLNK